jgi:hypothetical protein
MAKDYAPDIKFDKKANGAPYGINLPAPQVIRIGFYRPSSRCIHFAEANKRHRSCEHLTIIPSPPVDASLS